MKMNLKVVSFTLGRICCIHLAYGFPLLSWKPLFPCVIPDMMLWNFMILQFLCSLITFVEFKPTQQCCGLCLSQCFIWFITMEYKWMVIIFMYCKTLNTWISSMDIKGEKSPHAFWCSYESWVDKFLLIILVMGFHTNRGHIRTFVHIFVQILAGLDTAADFNIDMSILPLGKVWVVWNNIFLV